VATALAGLDRRALDGAERAEDAAVAGLGLEPEAAARARPKIHAGVGGHGPGFLRTTVRTGEGGFQDQLHTSEGRTAWGAAQRKLSSNLKFLQPLPRSSPPSNQLPPILP